MKHRTTDPADAGAGHETDEVPELLLTAHDALRGATQLITAQETPEAERGFAAFTENLAALLTEVEDITSTISADPLNEADRRSSLMALYVRGDAGRIAVLIEQVGDIASGRGTQSLARPLTGQVRELGEACVNLMAQAHDVLRVPGPLTMLNQGLADVTARQRRLSRLLLTGSLACSTRDALDAAVLGRCYEECAWRAVALAGVGLQARAPAMGAH
ncbi:hypothetical protein [Streptomyces violaceorubidus]|uniref:Phosphate transport system regulatory protein PhoU n=1 Tax=Streptomyces violaceorubidus TaxID=284042 RepID=A0ABV1SNZ2_9ACTN